MISPGVGDYKIENIDLKNKSPNCTIGNFKRFVEIPKGQKYIHNLPVSYQSIKLKNKSKMGVIGKEKRFDMSLSKVSPGPGAYQTELYKSLSKGQVSCMASSFN
jgi:hypothetical protein